MSKVHNVESTMGAMLTLGVAMLKDGFLRRRFYLILQDDAFIRERIYQMAILLDFIGDYFTI